MPRVSTPLHLPVTHDDNLTRQISICNDNNKFAAYPYSILREFTVNNKVIVMNHYETMRKLHAWCTDSERILKKIASIPYELDIL